MGTGGTTVLITDSTLTGAGLTTIEGNPLQNKSQSDTLRDTGSLSSTEGRCNNPSQPGATVPGPASCCNCKPYTSDQKDNILWGCPVHLPHGAASLLDTVFSQTIECNPCNCGTRTSKVCPQHGPHGAGLTNCPQCGTSSRSFVEIHSKWYCSGCNRLMETCCD